MLRLAFLTLLTVGCGEEEFRVDFSIPDQALEPFDLSGGLPDLEPRNFGDGGAGTACMLDGDCEIYNSNCGTCHCAAKTVASSPPFCPPTMIVDCTNQNPCAGHTAMCMMKSCVVQ